MPDTNPTALDDGLTDAERHYLASGGDVTDALVAENKDLPAQPAAPAAPAAEPGSGDAPPAGAAPAAGGADDDDEGEAVQPGKKPRRVAFAKFEAAEQARLDLERRLNEQAVNNARVEERLSLLQQALAEPAQPAAPAEEKPDPEKDIFGYARYLEKQLTTVADKVNGYEQQITAGQAEMESERNYFNSLNSYAAREPQFVNAYAFLLRNRAAELMAPRYPTATYEQLMGAEIPSDVAEILRQEERSLYKDAFEQKQNPADNIFRMARLRGFRPAAPANGNGGAAPANGAANGAANGKAANGAAQPAAPALPGTPLGAAPAAATPANGAALPANAATPTAADLVESIKRGQSAAMSLSNVAGGTGIELTPQVLADMPQDQFEALVNELEARGDKTRLKELFGA